MLCDLHRYELSARGPIRGAAVEPIVDAIDRLPHDSVVLLDLDDVPWIDADAAAALSTVISARQSEGVEISIKTRSLATLEFLVQVGLTPIVERPPERVGSMSSYDPAT